MAMLTLFEFEPERELQAYYARALNTPEGIATRDFYEVYHNLIAEASQKYGVPLLNAVIAFARLSPRVNVEVNKRAFLALLAGEPRTAGITSAIWRTAQTALLMTPAEIHSYLYEEPLSKVRAFARNLLLDTGCVCIDSIMLRILRYTHGIADRNTLFREYASIHTHLYTHIRALDEGVPPYKIQATLWGYARARLTPIEY